MFNHNYYVFLHSFFTYSYVYDKTFYIELLIKDFVFNLYSNHLLSAIIELLRKINEISHFFVHE